MQIELFSIEEQLEGLEGFERLEAALGILDQEDFSEVGEEEIQEWIDELEELRDELGPFMDQLTKNKLNEHLEALNTLLEE